MVELHHEAAVRISLDGQDKAFLERVELLKAEEGKNIQSEFLLVKLYFSKNYETQKYSSDWKAQLIDTDTS